MPSTDQISDPFANLGMNAEHHSPEAPSSDTSNVLDLDFDATFDGPFDSDPPDNGRWDPTFISTIEEASKQGDLVAVKNAFAAMRGDAEEEKSYNTGSSLTFAAQNGHLEVVDYLFSQGAKVTINFVKRVTLTRTTSAVPVLDLALKYGWDIYQETSWAEPPALAYAVDDDDLCQWFLSHGADPNARCTFDITPLSFALSFGTRNNIRRLFESGGSIEHGQLLHHAGRRKAEDRLDVIKDIIGKGAPVNAILYQSHPASWAVHGLFGCGTPLHEAAQRGDEEVAQLLLDHGASITIPDSSGGLPYQRAQRQGHDILAKSLMPTPLWPAHL